MSKKAVGGGTRTILESRGDVGGRMLCKWAALAKMTQIPELQRRGGSTSSSRTR